VFVNRRSGFYEKDRELPVLGMAIIKVRNGSSTVAKIVPAFIFEGETCFGREGFDADKHDAEIVVVPPGIENVEDFVNSEFARILPCPELDEVEQ